MDKAYKITFAAVWVMVVIMWLTFPDEDDEPQKPCQESYYYMDKGIEDESRDDRRMIAGTNYERAKEMSQGRPIGVWKECN